MTRLNREIIVYNFFELFLGQWRRICDFVLKKMKDQLPRISQYWSGLNWFISDWKGLLRLETTSFDGLEIQFCNTVMAELGY